MSSSLALLLGAAALAWSPGPRRGTQILSPTSWLVLIAPGVVMMLTQPDLGPSPSGWWLSSSSRRSPWPLPVSC